MLREDGKNPPSPTSNSLGDTARGRSGTEAISNKDVRAGWCRGTESNRRRKAFQAFALPTELPRPLETETVERGIVTERDTVAKPELIAFLEGL